MTDRITGLVLAAVVLCFGCAEGAPDDGSDAGDGGASVTADLLENPPSAQQSPEVNVTELGHDEGDLRAPIYIVEFSDFGCGYCRKFHLETLPTLRSEFIEAGKVSWKIIPFVTGMFSNSRAASTAAECAARQDRFQAMSHELFRDQSTWKPADEPRTHFRDYASRLGLDADAFDRCLEEDPAGDRIERATRAADRLGVRATPTFFIDGYPVQGAIPVDLFREVLETRLAELEESGS